MAATRRRRAPLAQLTLGVLFPLVLIVPALGAVYDPDPGPLRLERRFVEVSGRRMAFHQTGSGPDVVLLHGGMGSAEDFEPLIPLLQSSRRLTLVDRPGFGGSDVGGDDYTFAGNARQVAAVIRSLKLARPVVVGHSHGGGVALRLALDQPELVGSLVLLAPRGLPTGDGPGVLSRLTALPLVGPGLLAGLGPLLGPRMIRKTLEAALGPDAAKAGPEFVSWRVELWTAPRSLATHTRQQVSDEAGLVEQQARYGQLQVPVVAIRCDHDPHEGQDLDTHRLAAVLPHAREIALTGCGHYIQYGQPQAVAEAILGLEAAPAATP